MKINAYVIVLFLCRYSN